MVTDAREPSRGYHVPSTDNTISEDMARLILALTAVGVDVAGLLEAVASKAAAIHDHQIADIIGLVAALANKASADHVHALGGLSDVDTAGASVYQVLAKSLDGKWRPWTIDLANAIGGAAYARLDGATFTGPTKVPTPSTEANSLNAVNVTSLRAFVTSAVAALTLLMEGYVSHSQEQTLSAEQKARAQTNLGLEGLQNALTPFGFTATAGQTAFALGMSPLPSACIFSLNGAWLTGGGVDYTVAGSTLTLTTAAQAGDRISGVAIAPFTVANAMLSAANLADLANVAVARGNLGLGSAAVEAAGTGANEVLKLDAAGKIPAVDGSLIIGIGLQLLAAVDLPATTFYDVTGIPASAKRITVVLGGVSTNGANPVKLQLGTSGGIDAAGYNGNMVISAGSGVSTGIHSTGGYTTFSGGDAAASSRESIITFMKLKSNTWIAAGITADDGVNRMSIGSARKALSGALDRIRITSDGGMDVFDGGSMTIYVE